MKKLPHQLVLCVGWHHVMRSMQITVNLLVRLLHIVQPDSESADH